MFTLTEFSGRTQRTACMLLSVVIVAAAFSFGVYDIGSMPEHGYSVTVTQLQ